MQGMADSPNKHQPSESEDAPPLEGERTQITSIHHIEDGEHTQQIDSAALLAEQDDEEAATAEHPRPGPDSPGGAS